MPHAEDKAVPAPTIEPIRSQSRGNPNEITKNTLIQISTENPLLKIYFTTDGTIPDAFNRLIGSREVTHKYKAPFGLKPGSRTINAIAYTRNGKQCSAVSTRQFDVLYTDSDLSLIGEEDEDATSTVLLSHRLHDVTSSGTDDNDAAQRGSSRYMEKLKRHLDQSATSSGSDLDYETPRSIRELLNQVETPHSVRNGRSARGETDLSTTEWQRLQELEEEHRRAAEQADYLRAQEAEHELEYEQAREREDQLRRYVEDEEYHETRAREVELYHAHQAELEDQERRLAWQTARSDCDCDDDKATHITDFFYSSDNRLSNSYDRHHNEPYTYRSTGSVQKSDHDYGITGVVGSCSTNGGYRQDPLSTDCVCCTSRCASTEPGTQHDVHAAYRRQVDSELMDHVMANRSRRSQTDVLFDDDCAECRAAALRDRSLLDHRERPLIDRHETVGRVSTGHISEVDRLFEKAARNDPLIDRHRRRSPSPHRSHSPRLSRSRSRERRPQGILKRGTSLERARSREREREGHSRSRERDGRSRSPSIERRRRLSRDRVGIESMERGRSRSRDRVDRRVHSRSPSPRDRTGELRLELDTNRTPRLTVAEHRPHRVSKYESDPEVRSRPQRSKYTNLRDTSLSLEEIDARLSQLEESDSSLNAPRRGRAHAGDRQRESGTALKKKKDSANLKKSSDAKKKPVTKPPPSPPSSSVSSSLSSSSSASEEEKEKEKLVVNGSQVKRPGSGSQVKRPGSTKGAGSSQAVVPKVVKPNKDSDNKKGKKTAEGALNFFNDSGTQINFWGMSPEEITQRLQEHPEMAEAMAAVNGAARGARATNGAARGPGAMNGAAGIQRGSAPPTEEESELDEAVDHFFITEARNRPAVKAARQTSAFSEAYMDEDEEDGFCPVESVTAGNVQSAPVSSVQQADQHGIFSTIGDKVKNFFGGGDKKKVGVTTFTKVNYAEVKKACRKAKKLWEDPDFPAADSSLYHTELPQLHPFEWKRPHEICKNPQFIVDGASRFDVKQGVLGNCWLLAAVASLAGDEKLLYRVIYPEQSFQKEYAGIFRFQFWQYGEWVDVCIDDRLPTKAGRLVYMHSAQEDEFWSPLIEKAYAKLNGCYENLSGGLTSEAMTDFTGGLVETFNFREELPDNMFQILHKAFTRGSLMGCSIDASPDKMEQQLNNGLIIGHAYSITDIKEVAGNSGQHQLVRVRNPWGNHCEWTGAWSDTSKEWKSIPEKTRSKIGMTTSHDGEFWMSIRDFTTHFQRVEICNQDRSGTGAWESRFINNAWVRNVSAGGCRNYPDTYPTNPQFEVVVTDMDDDDDEQVGTVILALLQKDRRRLRPTGGGNLTIGYDIFQVGSKSKGTLDKKYFRKAGPVASSPQYINQREVTGRHRLTPGKYVVIPTTFDSNEEADFLLRVYSEKEAGLMESDVPTSVNSKITAKTMAVAHSAPGQRQKSHEVEQHFRARAGDDLEVDAYELLEILNSTFSKDFSFGSFNINSCRSMVAIRDTDATGMLGLDEFKSLWDDLVMWKQVFKKHDKDESGFFSSFELREALKSIGYNVSNVAFKNIVMRYSDREGRVQFNDFLDCIVRLKTLFELHERSEQEQSAAALPLDTFIATFMYT